MTTDPAHLTPAAAQLLSESNANRMRAVLAERWVHYPRAGQVLQILNRLLDYPRTTRMPSIAIYGDSGMGKTMIMEKFRRDHPPLFDGEARLSGPGSWLCRWPGSRVSDASTRRS